VCLLGGLRVVRGDVTLRASELGSRKARTVLALLAADPARTLSSSALAELMWPERPPDSAAATVASLVSRLRRTLGPVIIEGGRTGYRLGPPPAVEVDLAAAARLVDEAERRAGGGQPGLAAAAAEAALTVLETGGALADEGESDWLGPVRAEQAALLRRTRHVLAAAALATGDRKTAQRVSAAAVAADPLDEDAARTLIGALAAAGEVGAALSTYERLRRELAEQLGADPAPATRAAHAAILRGEPADPGGPAVRTAPRPALFGLAGRDRELDRLQQAWAAAAAGDGSLVLLNGDPGAGKTRLAEELAAVVRATGGAVLLARCYEAERALFLQPAVEAIATAAATWPAAAVRTAAVDHLESLVRLVPELAAITASGPVTPGRADVERRRSVDAVSTFFCRLADVTPLLLILDDLQNAGRSTLELLHYFRTRLGTARLLVVGTVRRAEGAAVLRALAPVATQVEVGALPAEGVRALAAAAGQPELAEQIVRRTRGHALFVVEILRGLTSGSTLPESLQSAVVARIRGLDPPAEDVLRAGAVLGTNFDPRLSAELADVPAAAALRCCEQALAAGVLVVRGRHYEFANDVLREVVYATTPAPTRSAHHARAVDLLADRPEQVAEHATAIEDWGRAARAWLMAAEQALHRFAAADAVTLAGAAGDAAQRSGDGRLVARALLVRGQATYVTGDYQASWADVGAAVRTAQESGDRRLEMLALREKSHDLHVALGRPPAETEAPMRECLRIAESLGDHTRVADVLDRLTILALSRLDFVGALELAEQALRVGRAADRGPALICGLDAAKSARAYLGDAAALAPIVAELEPLERTAGDLLMLQWTVFESAVVPLAAGDLAGADARVDTAVALNRRSGYTVMEPFFTSHAGWLRRLAGDLAGADELGAHAVATGRANPHAWWLATAAGFHGTTLLALGRAEEARRTVEEFLPGVDVAGAEGYRLRCLSALAAATDSADVLADADALLHSIATPPGHAWLLGADAYLNVARAWAARGEPGRAAETVAPLRAATRRLGWAPLARLADRLVAG
jgi:DNA-binding SARP family transcriptional activator